MRNQEALRFASYGGFEMRTLTIAVLILPAMVMVVGVAAVIATTAMAADFILEP